MISKILELDDYGGRGTELPTCKLFSVKNTGIG